MGDDHGHAVDAVGDFDTVRRVQEKLQCKDFSWFLENVYPENAVSDCRKSSDFGQLFLADADRCLRVHRYGRVAADLAECKAPRAQGTPVSEVCRGCRRPYACLCLRAVCVCVFRGAGRGRCACAWKCMCMCMCGFVRLGTVVALSVVGLVVPVFLFFGQLAVVRAVEGHHHPCIDGRAGAEAIFDGSRVSARGFRD